MKNRWKLSLFQRGRCPWFTQLCHFITFFK
jgi:hypothetical protein